MRTRITLFAFLVLGALVAAGCSSGGAGDPCKEPQDCNSGLMCCGNGDLNRGTCSASCGAPDAGQPSEDAGLDAGRDAGADAGADAAADAAMDGAASSDAATDGGADAAGDAG